MDIFEKRSLTMFEKGLLIVGVLVILTGFFLINRLFQIDQALTWNLLIASFLWLLMVLLLILVSTNQAIKEELIVIIKETNEEIKLLRQDLNKRKR